MNFIFILKLILMDKMNQLKHLFGYLNPYYRTAYSIPKRKR